MVETPGEPGRWVVSRALCAYCRFDLAQVDKAKRNQALANQVELASPYGASGGDSCYEVRWSDGIAQVWIWSRKEHEEALQILADHRDDPALVEVIPESLLTTPLGDGVSCYRSMDGYIAQAWENGVLRNERFWREAPDDSDWRRFLQAAGHPPAPWTEPETAIKPDGAPWGDRRSANARLYEPRVALAVLCLFAFLLAFQAFTHVEMNLAIWKLQGDVEDLQSDMRPALKARNEAFQMLDENRQLREVHLASQLGYMKLVMEALNASDLDGQLREWVYQDGQLQLLVNDPGGDLESYAAALDGVREFDDIKLTPDDRRNYLEISLEVVN